MFNSYGEITNHHPDSHMKNDGGQSSQGFHKQDTAICKSNNMRTRVMIESQAHRFESFLQIAAFS